jgi:hypothetical protein
MSKERKTNISNNKNYINNSKSDSSSITSDSGDSGDSADYIVSISESRCYYFKPGVPFLFLSKKHVVNDDIENGDNVFNQIIEQFIRNIEINSYYSSEDDISDSEMIYLIMKIIALIMKMISLMVKMILIIILL